MIPSELEDLLSDAGRLIPRILETLDSHTSRMMVFDAVAADLTATSAVLLLLGRCGESAAHPGEICLILNQRSVRVRQAGDLCCPGGSVSRRFDFHAARLLALPPAPLGRWPRWRTWRRQRPHESRWLALYFATALREAFEEMRLNPLRVRFLGPLPHHRLVLFRRLIYPLAVWAPRQKSFKPNWEVARIVGIPLRQLLSPEYYVRYRLTMELASEAGQPDSVREVPAFRLPSGDGASILWGATYRITQSFLQIVFGFSPPAIESLPLVSGHLGKSYLTGER
jgi:8-oxo-dGTP pyrophosphatase MutT (NUDIX family)